MNTEPDLCRRWITEGEGEFPDEPPVCFSQERDVETRGDEVTEAVAPLVS